MKWTSTPRTAATLLLPSLGLALLPASCRAQGAPLSLEEAVRTALAQHPQVGAARANEAAAEARVGQARAPWLPQLGASTALRPSYDYQTGAENPQRQQVRYDAQFTLSQQIYDFGRIGGRVAAAQAASGAARGDRAQIQAQVALGAITGFYGVLQAEALYEAAQENLKQQERRLRQAESLVAIGTRPEIDVLTARTGKAQAELNVLQARNQALLSRVQLLQALGVTDQRWLSRPLVATALEPVPEETQALERLLPRALQQRPEHLALRERLRQAEAQLRAVHADYLPQLSLTGSAQMTGCIGDVSVCGGGGRLDPLTAGQPRFVLNAALLLSWSPLQGLQTYYQAREAQALVAAARANLEALEQQVRSGLQQALFQVQSSRAALVAAEALQAQAERQLAMAAGRYEAGVGNIIELGDAQMGAVQARAQRVQADYDLQVARAGLRLQLGQLPSRAETREEVR